MKVFVVVEHVIFLKKIKKKKRKKEKKLLIIKRIDYLIEKIVE